jgi:hypothetical protein
MLPKTYQLKLIGDFLFYSNQLDLKDGGAVGWNVGARTQLSVTELRRHEELPLGTQRHELQSFPPSVHAPV